MAVTTTFDHTNTATTRATSPVKRVKKRTQPGLGMQLLMAGSAACVADLITFPLDTAKVRLQVGYKM